uniref:Reverse transcriptase domain-containing protein n=1 Tax=Tanacetum cinerariifolium TaxID=118510 RepID=A0A6L2JQV4_TANCI|nr:hypothetical protein [Tanacetum cinerariifolium]
MNQSFYNSFDFDQIQPPQYLIMSEEIMQAIENLMQYIQTFLKKFNRISFRETPKVLSRAWDKLFEIQHALPEDINELLRKLLEDFQIINKQLVEYINSPSWDCPTFYNDDDKYSIQYKEYLENSSNKIAPVLPTEEPKNSLSMGDEHLSTILETESDEVITSSVEDLVPIPSESVGILDNMCNVPFNDKNHFDAESDLIESLLTRDSSIVYSPKIDSLLEEFAGELAHIDPIPSGIDETDSDPKDDIRFIEQLLYDDTSSEDDSFEDIDYVEASPPDSKLVGLEEMKDEILRAKLLNIHLLIDKIESLNNNSTPDYVLKSPSSSFLSYSDNSLPEFEKFSDHTKETSSGSTTTHADNSLPEYDSFLFEIEPDQGELSSIVMEAILGEPHVYVPNVLPTHPTLYQDSDFSSSDDSLGSGLDISFPFETRNKIFDPGIFIDAQSKRLLSREEFSISFIRDPLYPVFKPDILSYLLISHRDKITSDFSENPMMYGGDIPHLDVLFLHFNPP